MDPIALFNEWYQLELQESKLDIPSACCLSTIGLDGYPNARFVSFREVKNNRFVFTGSLASRKGIEASTNTKVALTFWWTATECQIRIQGNAIKISETDAKTYFGSRKRSAQLVSLISQQGKTMEDISKLEKEFHKLEVSMDTSKIPTPKNWGGFAIQPIRIEFLKFNSNRFHNRVVFHKLKKGWKRENLQP